MKIAIQGIKGSFHSWAAIKYFGENIDFLECDTFRELAFGLKNKKSDLAVMAIENSIVGTILPNYSLILNNDLEIIGEVYISINQCLMAKNKISLEDITEVYSHPMAIFQCEKYFENHPNIKLIESLDTALSAKNVSQNPKRNIAAIAPKLSAKEFGLEIIEENIQTIKNNFTRFFILSANPQKKDKNSDKASLKIITNHSIGSLANVLQIISDLGVNMSKIQSIPIANEPWNYSFLIDVLFGEYSVLEDLIRKLKLMTSEVKVLGIYKQGKK